MVHCVEGQASSPEESFTNLLLLLLSEAVGLEHRGRIWTPCWRSRCGTVSEKPGILRSLDCAGRTMVSNGMFLSGRATQ